MGLRPAKSHEKLVLQDWWGGPPWSAADAPVGLLAPRKMLMSLCRLRDEGACLAAGVRANQPRGCGFSTLSTYFNRFCLLILPLPSRSAPAPISMIVPGSGLAVGGSITNAWARPVHFTSSRKRGPLKLKLVYAGVASRF